jgi:hypothetical protein
MTPTVVSDPYFTPSSCDIHCCTLRASWSVFAAPSAPSPSRDPSGATAAFNLPVSAASVDREGDRAVCSGFL